MTKAKQKNPWFFIPTLYFAEGLPYILINTASVILYKNMGVPNSDIAFWTSWLYLPWVIKMLWGPMVDTFGTRRGWIFWTQISMAGCLAAAALSLAGTHFFAMSLVMFALGAFVSATHDIAADGYYMLALTKEDQAFFVGIRSTFYRLAMIFGTGFLVFRAGKMQEAGMTAAASWGTMLLVSAAIFALIAIYHRFMMPYPDDDFAKAKAEPAIIMKSAGMLAVYLLLAALVIALFVCLKGVWAKLSAAAALVAVLIAVYKLILAPKLKNTKEGDFNAVFAEYFSQKGIGWIIAFILLYRLGEAVLGKMTSPFMLDPVSAGGLGLPTSQVGIIYGTIGILGLVLGGILGGWLISKYGFRRCLWPMVIALNGPDLFYLYLAYCQPSVEQTALFGMQIPNLLVSSLVFIEQFGYGVGFTAFTVYLMLICRGNYKTAHYAISTGIMALGMMIPGMLSGMLQEAVGYKMFFLIVCILTVPGMLVIFKLPMPADEDNSATVK